MKNQTTQEEVFAAAKVSPNDWFIVAADYKADAWFLRNNEETLKMDVRRVDGKLVASASQQLKKLF